MDKIASPKALQLELQFLITSCTKGSMGSPRPSREKLAARLNELADRVAAVPTPAEVDAKNAAMLRPKIQGAQALHAHLKSVSYTDYNIGDFFRDDLPKARTLSDRITKQKKQLEVTLSGFIRQAKKDLQNAEKSR